LEIGEWVCAVPLGGNLGMGVVITSYNQWIFISIVAEPRLVPDLDRLRGFVGEAFDELRQGLPQGVNGSRAGGSHAAAV
jgi:hypothetical protein